MDKEILEVLKAMQNQMNGMQNQMNEMHVDIKIIKDTQKEHGDILKQLNSFEKSTQLAHERIDAKLKKIENGIEVLAKEDFHIKTDIISVKEDLKVIRGGKE